MDPKKAFEAFFATRSFFDRAGPSDFRIEEINNGRTEYNVWQEVDPRHLRYVMVPNGGVMEVFGINCEGHLYKEDEVKL